MRCWNDTETGRPKCSEKFLSQSQFSQDKSHTDCPQIGPVLPQGNRGRLTSQPWQGLTDLVGQVPCLKGKGIRIIVKLWCCVELFCSICRRVHISEKTLSYLNGEFEVEPGLGEKREETLRMAGIKTFFIVKALKPVSTACTKKRCNK